jgi:hypothetical protein
MQRPIHQLKCVQLSIVLMLSVWVISPVFAADVTIAWDPKVDPGVAGYHLYYGTAPGVYNSSVNVGSETTYTVTGLGPGTYYFTVTAYYSSGHETGFSNEMSQVVSALSSSYTALPTVSLAAPANGSSVSGTLTVSADSSNSAGVLGIQFLLDGVNLGPEDLVAPYSIAWDTTTVSTGSHTLVARARDGAGNRLTSTPVTVNVAADNNGVILPSPWENQDIGRVSVTGGAVYSNGTFIVQGSGTDIGENGDAFHFVHRPWNGDGQIIARVVGIQNSGAGARAGLMIRKNVEDDSHHVMMLLTSGNGAVFQYHDNGGAASTGTTVGTETAPYWLKLVRDRDSLTGYKSDDGIGWELVGSSTMNLGNTVELGLVVSSQNDPVLCTSTMDNVSVVAFEN